MPQDPMQDLYNDANTLSKQWDACRALATAGYVTAYKNDAKALNKVKEGLEHDQRSLYLLFVGIIGSLAGPWVGRLLEVGSKLQIMQPVRFFLRRPNRWATKPPIS